MADVAATDKTDRPTPSASRERLLLAIGEVFETRGYDGATLTLLSAATGLGKASLYHHFPGGKADMAAALLRDRVALLETAGVLEAAGQPAALRAAGSEFIDGFREYVEDGNRNCLLLVFRDGTAGAQHGADHRRPVCGLAEPAGSHVRRIRAHEAEAGGASRLPSCSPAFTALW